MNIPPSATSPTIDEERHVEEALEARTLEIAGTADLPETPDQPFAEGAQDAIDPDLRHRLISEAAYRRYAERNYEDGYDVDDWLEAEADVDHLLLNAPSPARHGREA